MKTALGSAVLSMTASLKFPVDHAEVFRSPGGVSYLKEAGVALIAQPVVCPEVLRGFLDGFDESLEFPAYLDDSFGGISPGAQLAKIAGQLCYMSLGSGRSMNADVQKYLQNIKEQKHGSVIEHPTYSFLLYGISRSLTHEWVRHRAGWAYSQISQRYVDGKVLRFVMRPEYDGIPKLTDRFHRRIEQMHAEYHEVGEVLFASQGDGLQILSAEKKRDLRKKVNQAARSVLANETETAMIVSGNARAIRHFLEMRASQFAEIEIRRAAMKIFRIMAIVEPIIFSDYRVVDLPDGTEELQTDFRKV